MELIHLVALDNRINHEITPLNSTAIYPKLNHALYCVLTSKTKSLFYTFVLIVIGFCFSLYSFLSWST
jgi:hypothetical protein